MPKSVKIVNRRTYSSLRVENNYYVVLHCISYQIQLMLFLIIKNENVPLWACECV